MKWGGCTMAVFSYFVLLFCVWLKDMGFLVLAIVRLFSILYNSQHNSRQQILFCAVYKFQYSLIKKMFEEIGNEADNFFNEVYLYGQSLSEHFNITNWSQINQVLNTFTLRFFPGILVSASESLSEGWCTWLQESPQYCPHSGLNDW